MAYKIIASGYYQLYHQVANPVPRAKNWLAFVPVFKPGGYFVIQTHNPITKAALSCVMLKGQRGFVTSAQEAAFEALTSKLVFMGPPDAKPQPRKAGRPPQPRKAFDVASFLKSLGNEPLTVRQLEHEAAAQGFSRHRFYAGGLLKEIKAHLQQTDCGRWILPPTK